MKIIFTFLAAFSFHLSASSQVLCIKCYNQNTRVLTDTNNLMVNGGFEFTTCNPVGVINDTSFCPNSQYYHCDIANWTCTGGGISTYAFVINSAFSIIVEGTKSVYFGNYYAHACLNNLFDTSCISDIGCEVTGIPTGFPYNDTSYGGTTGINLEQTVNGLTVGAVYKLEFWAGGEWSYPKRGIFAVDVGFGNIMLRDLPTRPSTGIGMRYVIVFVATSTSHTIKFTNWGHICGTCTELVLDDVRLFPASPDENLCITTINELTNNTPTVFPNPATNSLTVMTNANHRSVIILYDITLRKLIEENFSGEVSLSIEHLSKGVYLYEIRDETGDMRQGKMVKE